MSRLAWFAERLWIADGPTVDFFGFDYPTRMVVVELEKGLWVWSPIELDPELEAEVRTLGEVRWIVSPNKIHHLFIGAWLSSFSAAKAYSPPGLAERRPGLSFAGQLTDTAEPAWSNEIEQIIVKGSRVMEEVVFFHKASSTCIVGDLIQRHEPAAFEGWKRAAMRLDGLLGPDGSTPREWRASFLGRKRGRVALERIRDWNAERLVVAHGTCATEAGAEVLSRGLSWLRRPWPV